VAEIILPEVLNHCISLARAADKVIMSVYGEAFEVDLKADTSPVTQADLLSDKLIVSSLKAEYPNVAVLSEETVDDKKRLNNDWCFIIDPLDGTKGFVARNGEFTVNIALAHKQKVVLGVVSVPATGEVYYAAEGFGAFYEKDGTKTPIHVSGRTDNLRMVRSRNHPDPREETVMAALGIDSAVHSGSSLKGCLIAHGKAETYYRFGETSEWDTAAMQCIVEQAGGIFRQTDNSPMLYNREDTRNRLGFFAVNCTENIWMQGD
jgi:3'(2'), 5'-bisphosphate nucleotidase